MSYNSTYLRFMMSYKQQEKQWKSKKKKSKKSVNVAVYWNTASICLTSTSFQNVYKLNSIKQLTDNKKTLANSNHVVGEAQKEFHNISHLL